MSKGRLASTFGKKLNIGLVGVVILVLIALISACTPTSEAIDAAVQSTLTAEAESQTATAQAQAAFDSAVAQAVGTQISAALGGLQIPTVTPTSIFHENNEEKPDELARSGAALATQDWLDQQAVDALVATNEAKLNDAEGGGPNATLAAASVHMAEVIANSNVNVRTGPGTEYEFIVSVRPQTRWVVLGKSTNGWLNIYLDPINETAGWISEEFVAIERGVFESGNFIFVSNSTISEVPFVVTPVASVTPTRYFPSVTPSPTLTPTPSITPTPSPTATPDYSITIDVINNSGIFVCRVEIERVGYSNDSNRLDDPPLLSGQTESVRLGRGAGRYDLRAWDCDQSPALVDRENEYYLDDDSFWVISRPDPELDSPETGYVDPAGPIIGISD